MKRENSEHLKAVSIQIVDEISEKYARIARHIIGVEDLVSGQALRSLLLTVAETIRETYGEEES